VSAAARGMRGVPAGAFVPYEAEAVALYERRRWWLGLTMGDTLDRAADMYPGKEALVGEGRRCTYAELRHLSDVLAYRLLDEGLAPGDRVLLQLPNWTDFVIAYYALQKAGLIMVLLTVNHTAREVAHLARLTEPRGWIVALRHRTTEFAPLIAQVRAEAPVLDVVVVDHGPDPEVGSLPAPDGCVTFSSMLMTAAGPGAVAARLEEARPDSRDVCQILPSGGTTGLPKGAPRTHDDYLCNVEYVAKAWDYNVTDRCLVAATVGHNLALLVCITAGVFQGATLVIRDSTRAEDFCRVVEEERITCTGLVPTLVSRFVSYDGLSDYDLSSLKKVYVGASNSPPDLVRAVQERMGVVYINAFGMVEGPCSQSRPDDPEEVRYNTIGRRCCPYDELVTLDGEGAPTPPGIEGELAAKGPSIFTGYWLNPQANQQAFTPDGYFRTGDLAVIDASGLIRITGRIKDIIIRGGENIAARDVEDLVSAHPAVEYVAVIGLPDADLGEVVCAVVKTVQGATVTHEEVVAHLETLEAPRSLVPVHTEIMAEIPLTAAGKADKKVLRVIIAEKLGLSG
jgi:non-ribosomal peptide synthetase component E (peptide arylation enzyme)